MALTDENGGGMVMPVSPMYGNGGGFGSFGGDGGGFWILILFILLGGWGNGFGGGFGGGDMYPWLNQSNQINGGFRDQMIGTQINGITGSISGLSNQLCNGFAGITNTLNSNMIADLERSFAAQTANTAGMTGLQAQMAQCCCDNRAATADLKYTVSTEACADRAAISSALRDVIDATQKQTQVILDKLCAQEIDALKERNLELQNRVNMQNLAASQVAQTAQLIADNTAQTQYLVNRISPYPVPSWTVANPNTPAA